MPLALLCQSLLLPLYTSFPLCTQHYHTVYKHCHPESVPECVLCGSMCRHCVDSMVHALRAKVDVFQDRLQQCYSNVTDHNEVTLPLDLTQYGWKIVQGKLECGYIEV